MGISNWALDPAKMNRAVHLHRPAPTVDDLALTAKGMLQCEAGDGASKGGASSNNRLLKGLAIGYERVYREQKLPDFWGLRDFYALVRTIGQRQVDGIFYAFMHRCRTRIIALSQQAGKGAKALNVNVWVDHP